jgi:hypothetical protein
MINLGIDSKYNFISAVFLVYCITMNAGLKQGMRHQLRNRLSGSAPLSGFRNAKAFAVAGKKTE